MKKFLKLFIKGKQKEGNIYSLYDVELTDNVNDNLQKNAFKQYLFDSDRPNTSCCITSDVRVGKSSLHKSSASASTPCIFTTALTDLEEFDTQYEKDTGPVSDLSKSTSASSISEILTKQEQKPHLEGIKKSRKNMYVITINNSKNFHIGSQKTVNIRERVNVDTRPCVDSHKSELPACLSQLLDCENKLTEEHITLISLHANDRWRQFLQDLGLEEGFLQMLERRNDNNKALTLYDGLQEYIILYPNTSLGFVINVLINTQQAAIVEKMAQEIKI